MGNSTASAVQALVNARKPSDKEQAVQWLCDRVARYTSHDNYLKAVCSCASDSLLELLKTGTPKAKELGAATISHLARQPDNKALFAEKGCIPELVELAKSDEPGRGAAATAIANLSSRCPANQKAVVQAGGVEALMQLLETGLLHEKAWAAVALGNTALQIPENQSKVVQAGAIKPLLVLAATPPTAKKATDQGALSDIWASLTCQRRNSRPDGSENKESENDVPELAVSKALFAISSLAYNHKENALLICEAGGLEVLVDVLKSGGRQSKAEAAQALCNVASRDAAVSSRLVDAGAVQPLLELCSSGPEAALAPAAAMLTSLCMSSEASKKHIKEAGGLEALVKLQRSKSEQAVMWATRGLLLLAQEDEQSGALIKELGGVVIPNLAGAETKAMKLSRVDGVSETSKTK